MIVIGLDPGSTTGYGLLRDGQLLEAGVIEGGSGGLACRLEMIYSGLCAILDEHHPDLAAVEECQYHPAKPGAVVPLASVRGVLLLALQQRGVEIVDMTATEVKAAITGSGQASKTTVRSMVGQQIGEDLSGEAFDTSDALALALVAWRRRQGRRVA